MNVYKSCTYLALRALRHYFFFFLLLHDWSLGIFVYTAMLFMWSHRNYLEQITSVATFRGNTTDNFWRKIIGSTWGVELVDSCTVVYKLNHCATTFIDMSLFGGNLWEQNNKHIRKAVLENLIALLTKHLWDLYNLRKVFMNWTKHRVLIFILEFGW